MVLNVFFFIILNLHPVKAQAIELPTGMNRTELSEVTDTVGVNTSAKFLSHPHALGGHEGFEFGIATEFISTGDLFRLGNQTERDETFQYNRITAGKGLYNNIDLYLHFIPFSNSNTVSEYGGMARWMFYESKRMPLSLSFLGHYSAIDIGDSFTNESIGWNLLGGLTLTNSAIYFGGGNVKTQSTYGQSLIDCAAPPNCSADIRLNENNNFVIANSYGHSFFGVYFRISRFFVAAQIDRYVQPVYSAKIGLRF